MVLAARARQQYPTLVAALYPILDVDACAAHGLSPLLVAQVWVELGVRKLQVRAKSWAADATLGLLRQVRAVTRQTDCAVFANDRLDLALLADCDGVHVGQQDLPVPVVRRTAPGMRVGVSTHDLEQLERALADKPDYVAFGPVFATRSKLRAEAEVGVTALAQAHVRARESGVPLVAIGGLSVECAAQIAPHCDEVAIIGALMGDSPTRVREFTKRLQAAFA